MSHNHNHSNEDPENSFGSYHWRLYEPDECLLCARDRNMAKKEEEYVEEEEVGEEVEEGQEENEPVDWNDPLQVLYAQAGWI